MDRKEIYSRVDHTLLGQDATWSQIKEICDDAMAYGTASVCIPPFHTPWRMERPVDGYRRPM